VSREKRDEAVASRRLFLVLTDKFNLFASASFPDRFAKILFVGGLLAGGLCAGQVYSRTRVRPSSHWISLGFHAGLWSNPSGSRLDGFPIDDY
jgi:hypothetical protein